MPIDVQDFFLKLELTRRQQAADDFRSCRQAGCRWHEDHRAGNVLPASFRGSGMSDRLVAAAEELTRGMGVNDLRIDTHRHNEAMKALLKRRGFQYRGNILVQIEEGHDPRRQAFEKVLT